MCFITIIAAQRQSGHQEGFSLFNLIHLCYLFSTLFRLLSALITTFILFSIVAFTDLRQQ